MLKDVKEDLSSQNQSLRAKYEAELSSNNQLKDEEAAANDARIQDLEEHVRELEEKCDNIQSQAIKD